MSLSLYRRQWERLPPELRTPQQVAGVAAVGCGATHSIMERCNFSCTSCYLSEDANRADPFPFAHVRVQLDALRRHLGTGGKVQITSGEVTLLPVDELGRIVAYARKIGLDPMVMTNGERWLASPDKLEALVSEYGLDKISIHIDTTQRGRPGLTPRHTETDLEPLRERFASLVRQTRRKTGRPLHAAQTVTVTEDNRSAVPDVTRWALENGDAFRILSFLPAAPVGRTEDVGSSRLDMEAVWELVCQGAGKDLNRHAMHFGHSECNITVPILVLRCGQERHLVEIVRAGRARDLEIFHWGLHHVQPGMDFGRGIVKNALHLIRALMGQPLWIGTLLSYALHRLWGERRGLLRLARGLTAFHRPRIHPLLLVVHRFMSADELQTPLGKKRLEACVFKLPVDGRMVSMCEVNATTLRRELNRRRVEAEID